MLKETKNKFQDIKPIKRKDIRQKKTIFKKQSFEKDIAKEEKNNTPKFTIWIIALISIIFLLFALSSLFSGATVTISPKSVNLTLSNSFDAFKNPTNDNLSFEVMVIEREKEKLTPITDTKVVERKATGRVIIYNTFDNNPQKLLIDTRLESPDGRIYKTDSPITVPGMKIVNDQSIPGSVEVGIYADEPGSEYNIGLSDFTIIGFKGSSKYEKFYGRSKTEVKGGLVGNINFINEEKAKQTQLEIRDILQKELLNQAKAQIPDGFVSYNNAIFLNFNDSDNSFFESENNSITIKESGSIQVILFNEAELSKTIARNTIDNFDESDVFIPDISGDNVHCHWP